MFRRSSSWVIASDGSLVNLNHIRAVIAKENLVALSWSTVPDIGESSVLALITCSSAEEAQATCERIGRRIGAFRP